VADNDEKEFRVRPRRARTPRPSSVPVPYIACRVMRHYAARAKAARCRKRTVPNNGAGKVHFQRCAIRVMYSQNSTCGQWRAHGRYITRESARRDGRPAAAFDEQNRESDIASRLEQWQSAGDERLWKLIISPEFGDRVDLAQLTRDVMARMEQDLGTHLEWVSVSHFNTDNPHVHVALRGVRDNGQSLTLGRDYISSGIRRVAEDLCTQQLGYRSGIDVIEAQRREVQQQRFTSLDRMIARDDPKGGGESDHFRVRRDPDPRHRLVIARLRALEEMGLAQPEAQGQWRVRRDFRTALRARQRAADRQKALASHGVPMSDTRLPLVMTPTRAIDSLEGRVLSHGEDEGTGRSFMLLEGTDAQIHWLYHNPEMTAARARGGLRANSFVRLRKLFVDGRPLLEVDELGHSERIANDRNFIRETALKLMRKGAVPPEGGWNGWLGRYQKALQNEAAEVQHRRAFRQRDRAAQREADRSMER
jgi:type IV secretory pathway VirD2 relaxase